MTDVTNTTLYHPKPFVPKLIVKDGLFFVLLIEM